MYHRNIRRSKNPSKKGYTLVELLLVIAIIIILASVILVSLNTVKIRARSVAAMQMANSLLKGAATHRDLNSGAFGDHWRAIIQGDPHTTLPHFDTHNGTTQCSQGSRFDSDASAQAVCKKILETVGESGNDWELILSSLESDKLSVMVRLPNGRVYCAGSNDRTSADTNWNGSGCGGGSDSWTCPGCARDVLNIN